jgi:hypothetical protein
MLRKHIQYITDRMWLKVLSSEMDQAESRLIPWNFIKGNVAAGF